MTTAVCPSCHPDHDVLADEIVECPACVLRSTPEFLGHALASIPPGRMVAAEMALGEATMEMQARNLQLRQAYDWLALANLAETRDFMRSRVRVRLASHREATRAYNLALSVEAAAREDLVRLLCRETSFCHHCGQTADRLTDVADARPVCDDCLEIFAAELPF